MEKKSGGLGSFGCGTVIFVCCLALLAEFISKSRHESPPETPPTPTQSAQEVMNVLQSTPQGRAEIERIGGRDVALTTFQKQEGISESIAEAAIKEWTLNHNGNFDWNLEEVKAICIRMRDGK